MDIKSDAESTYAVLHKVLKRYAEMLTVFSLDRTETIAVAVIVSGNRPRETMAARTLRYCAMDGRLSDLDSDVPLHLVPLISDSWGGFLRWQGRGEMPEAERRKLKQIVKRIHERGCLARFWGTPDTPPVWRETLAAGVALINTDDLADLEAFLLTHSRGKNHKELILSRAVAARLLLESGVTVWQLLASRGCNQCRFS